MTTTKKSVTLPTVSLGGYGATLKDLDAGTVLAKAMTQSEEVTRLTHLLAVAQGRKEIAWAEFHSRTDQAKEA